MKLPHFEKAYVPQAKLREYLLSPSHPEGGPKSVFFEMMGYSQQNIPELESALIDIALSEQVVYHFEFSFGNKYVVDGRLPRKNGTEIPLRTVWVIDKGETAPRFITAYPI
jgi:hypothetical protein